MLARKAPYPEKEVPVSTKPNVTDIGTDAGTTPIENTDAGKIKKSLEGLNISVEKITDVESLSVESLWVLYNIRKATRGDLQVVYASTNSFSIDGDATKSFYDEWKNAEQSSSSQPDSGRVAIIFPLVSAITYDNFESKYGFPRNSISIKENGFIFKSYEISVTKDVFNYTPSIDVDDNKNKFASYFTFVNVPVLVNPNPVDLSSDDSKIKFACSYFTFKEYNNVHTAGIIGNLMQESSLKTGAVGDGGISFGLAQWNGARRNNLNNFAVSKGKSTDDFSVQLDFINHELKGSGDNGGGSESKAYLALLTTKNIEDATRIFMLQYERPNPDYANLPARLIYANKVVDTCF